MKPKLEHIDLKNAQSSFRFFRREAAAFLPFWHYHPELELTLITKGQGTRFIGDSILSFSDFDLVLVGENLPHHWVSMHQIEASRNEAFVFQFDKQIFSLFPECRAFLSLFEEAEHGIHFTNPNNNLINQIINFESKSKISQLATFIEILQGLVEDKKRLVLSSNSYLDKYHKYGTQTKISKTTNFILEHLDQKLTVNQMSEFTNMVPQSFCRWFKNHSGHSFISFLNQTRIQRASHLLLSTNLNIQKIAFACGYESLSHFNRTFKKLKEESPREFRKK
ncbi:AraC-type DNA-binding protein [Flaviramulus basaltis]|uniref:AraC-type DNA-binding protein n=1 Tax=Flaviramulus basaltis TaxID=369401 RepID=A0A1K2IMR5_9FLAO|nr:AraC family transcriptional regulator [Flaviramulus basaltis]SFZ93546.1 AraC-type DNA-binding protein [Flaviramulus basaltis]